MVVLYLVGLHQRNQLADELLPVDLLAGGGFGDDHRLRHVWNHHRVHGRDVQRVADLVREGLQLGLVVGDGGREVQRRAGQRVDLTLALGQTADVAEIPCLIQLGLALHVRVDHGTGERPAPVAVGKDEFLGFPFLFHGRNQRCALVLCAAGQADAINGHVGDVGRMEFAHGDHQIEAMDAEAQRNQQTDH